MHAMVAKHYLSGAAYPIGGSASIAKGIVQVIEEKGGQVVTNSQVDEIISKGSRAVGIRLGDKIIKSSRIISSIGVRNTKKLLPDPKAQELLRKNWQMEAVEPSFAHLGMYIGLKDAQELDLKTTNMWLYHSHDYEKTLKTFENDPDAPFPIVYVSFPSAKDPEWNKNFPGKSTIEIVAPAPYSWFEKWENTKWQKRGKDYKDYKEELSQRLLKTLYQQVPQLEGQIDFYEMSTPLSTKNFCSYQKERSMESTILPRDLSKNGYAPTPPIRGLFLTGQDVVTCGVGGALVAGILTSIRVLGPLRSLGLLKILQPKRS